ncbi:DUF2157 domain-containing protein [Demequina sp.]|uniref:DUF2157 domain-containing protein n=1 Tax=Demequina sp. TaxID=2050685 RepID=UPI0025FA8439|nr:DUF2157 domain-containing protein [Demequina sp.]
MNGLDTRLDQWVEAGLISPDTASDLRLYESEHAADLAFEVAPESPTGAVVATPAAPSAPAAEPVGAPRALVIVGEVVGYLGALLIVSAVAFLLSRTWSDLSDVGRIGLVAGLTVIVAGAGALTARATQPPAQRLASVLLVATVALTGWLTWTVVHDGVEVSDDSAALWVTGAIAVTAGAIYAVRRRALAQLALLAGLVAVLAAAMRPWDEGTGGTWVGVLWAVLGVAWVVLAATRLLVPPAPGLVAGGFLAVFGMLLSATDDQRAVVLGVAVALSVAMLAVAIRRRDLMALIVPGAIGLLSNLPQLIQELVSDTLATWLAMLVAGLALVGIAVWLVRERQHRPPRPRHV